MENKKELVVSAIENGTVIDHIPTDVVYQVIRILGLEKYNDEVLIGNYLHSKKFGRKGIVKIKNKFFDKDEVNKIALIMKQAKLTTEYRRTTVAAHERKELSGVASAAIELQDGTIITARSSSLLGPCAALLLNALKHLANIPHETKMIPEALIAPIQKTKVEYLHGHNPRTLQA